MPRFDSGVNEALQGCNTAGALVYIRHGRREDAHFSLVGRKRSAAESEQGEGQIHIKKKNTN